MQTVVKVKYNTLIECEKTLNEWYVYYREAYVAKVATLVEALNLAEKLDHCMSINVVNIDADDDRAD